MISKIISKKRINQIWGWAITAIFVLLYNLTGPSTCFATTVTLQWGASSGASGYKVYYQADSSSQPFAGTGATQGNSPIDVSQQSEATISGLDPSHAYYFAVTAYNESGESTYSNVVAVPELLSPNISFTSPANNAKVNGTVSITAEASDNVGVTKVEFYVDGTLKGSDTSAPYVYSWDTSSLADGNYAVSAKAYDAAGNISDPATVTVSVTKDSTVPTVSLTSPSNGTTVSGTVSITAAANDNIGVTKVEFYENGNLLSATNVSPYSYTWNTLSAANGVYSLSAKAYDGANNTATSAAISVTVDNGDNEAPTVTLTSPANGSTISGTVAVTASASDNVTVTKVEFFINGNLAATDSSSPFIYNWNTTTASNGNYSLYAKAYDAANNVNTSTYASVTVNNPDTTPPSVSISSPTANATVSGTVAVIAVASDDVGVSGVNFYVDDVFKYSDKTSPFSFSWDTSALVNGVHTISARAYDAAGNINSSSVSVTVNNPDTLVPTISITSPASGSTINGTVSVSASASDNTGVSRVEFYVNGNLSNTDNSSPYSFNWNSVSTANGSYTLSAKAYDAAGNVGTSADVIVSVNNPDTTAPVVNIVSPVNGAVVAGTQTITVNASDNVGVSKVEFYVNGSIAGSDASAPYTYSWNTTPLANGPFTLSAKAYDAAGNVNSSSNVSVNVSNTVTTVPGAPGIGTATPGDAQATVSFNPPSSDGGSAITSYTVTSSGGQTASGTTSPITVTGLSNGSAYTFTVRATNSIGTGPASVASSSVTPAPAQNPISVALISPLNGATYGYPATIVLTAMATTSVVNTYITKVEFYNGSKLLKTVTSSPYSYTWKRMSTGSYNLTAKAYVSTGSSKVSAPVSVKVVSSSTTVSFTSVSQLSPKPVGTEVDFTTAASGGSGPYEYKFLVKNPVTGWATAQPYSTSSSFAWRTTGLPSGNYTIEVMARTVGASSNYEAYKTMKYSLK